MIDIDKIVFDLDREVERNESFLHLTANECRMSKLAMKYLSSNLGQRYYFGGGTDGVVDFGGFTFVGLKSVENILLEAESATKQMLRGCSVNMNCLSGVHAMMCAILSTTEPGDCVMTVSDSDGGHFATKGIIERIGRKHVFAVYDNTKLAFDLDRTEKIFKENNVKVFYMDISNHLKPAPVAEFRRRFGPDAVIIYDASHTMGLMMGQVFENPLDVGADIISANTHKTLPGPQKGMLVFKNQEMADRCNSIINGCLKSSAHTENLIALSIAILEMKEFGKSNATDIVNNANYLAKAFEEIGYEVRRIEPDKFTYTHQVHVFLPDGVDRLTAYKNLVKNNISSNFENVMGGRLFVRIGTSEVTRRGMGAIEMKMIASIVDRSLRGESTKDQVLSLLSRYENIKYSFDNIING
jgi:glycine/serine hydroxymethyltransferase